MDVPSFLPDPSSMPPPIAAVPPVVIDLLNDDDDNVDDDVVFLATHPQSAPPVPGGAAAAAADSSSSTDADAAPAAKRARTTAPAVPAVAAADDAPVTPPTLFPYQEQGVAWMQTLEKERGRNCPGGILADAPGVGKTRQIISLIARDGRATNTLLIVPKNVLVQWIPVVKAANMALCIFDGARGWIGTPSASKPTVYLTTHASLATPNTPRMIQPASPFVWHRFVVDEAHGLASVKGTRFAGLQTLRNRFRGASMWVVTGTPVVNSVANLQALYYLVTCTVKQRAEAGQAKEKSDALINTVMRWSFTHMMHRTAAELKLLYPDVPFPLDAERILRQIDVTDTQELALYDRLAQLIEPFIAATQRMQDKTAKNAQMLKLLGWLDQMNVSPDVFLRYRAKEKERAEEDEDAGNGVDGATAVAWPPLLDKPSAKMVQLQREMTADRRVNGPQHWLVFCWFKEEVAMLQAFFQSATMAPLVGRVRAIFGDSKRDEVQGMLDAYEQARATPPVADPADPVTNGTGKDDVLILNIKSGGEGLNLQNFTRVVFMTRWWTDAAIQQGVGRAVRMGQKEVVKVYALMLNHVLARLGQTLSMDRRKDSKALMKAELLRQLMRGAVPRVLSETEKQDVVKRVIELDSTLRTTSSSEDAWVCQRCGTVNMSGDACTKCRAVRFAPSSAPSGSSGSSVSSSSSYVPPPPPVVPGGAAASSAADVIDLTGGYLARASRGLFGGGGHFGMLSIR